MFLFLDNGSQRAGVDKSWSNSARLAPNTIQVVPTSWDLAASARNFVQKCSWDSFAAISQFLSGCLSGGEYSGERFCHDMRRVLREQFLFSMLCTPTPPAHIGRLAPKATRFGNIRNFCALCPKAFLQESSPQNKGKRAGGLREGLATRLSGLRTCALGKRDCSEQARHDTATCAAPLLSNSACERWVGSGRRRPPPRHA